MKLIKNQIYDLTESCGMMILKGKYLGIGEYKGDSYSGNLLVFEIEREGEFDPTRSKFTAVKPEAYINYNGEIEIILRTSYYGMTIEDIKPVTCWFRKNMFELKE